MSAGFYQRLGVSQDAATVEIQDAYQQGLARLVRRLRAARAGGADPAPIEAERGELQEAYEVLTDPVRRRRYDRMLSLEGQLPVNDVAAIREALLPALEDPAAAAAIELLSAVTRLELRGPEAPELRRPAAPARPVARPVSMMNAEQRMQRAQAVVAPLPEPASLPAPPMLQVQAPSIAVAPALPKGPDTAERDFLSGTFGYDGRYIAAVREAKGIALEELAETTRISERYLTAIEANQFERLPAAVFVRGYLKEIAAVLEVDEQPLVHGFMDLYAQARGA